MRKIILYSFISTLPLTLAAAQTSPAQSESAVPSKEKKVHNVLPALKVLPAGSILKDVSIPRYNKDYSPASILVAKKLTIVNDQQILGEQVDISLFDISGETTFKTHLNSLDYDQSKGLLKSSENLNLSGNLFLASAQGLVLDWDSQRGFLLGKNQTIIYLKESLSMKKKSSTTQTPPKKALAVAAAVAIVAGPSFLNAQDIAELDQLAKPATEKIQKLDSAVASDIIATKQVSDKITQAADELIQDIGELPQLAQDQAAPVALKPDAAKQHLSIKSDGLMFFDANKGMMVFSKNVVVKHPKFSLTCKTELKLILAENVDNKKLDAAAKAKLKPGGKFANLSKMIAINDVVMKSIDSKGNPITARCGTLTYDHKTESFVLRGLHSRISTTQGQTIIRKADGYIKVDKIGNITGKGLQFDVILPENKKKP